MATTFHWPAPNGQSESEFDWKSDSSFLIRSITLFYSLFQIGHTNPQT